MRWTSELTPSELKRIKEVGGEPKPLAPRWQKQPSAGASSLLAVPSPRELLGSQFGSAVAHCVSARVA